jgi:predicted nucleotidyltransferase
MKREEIVQFLRQQERDLQAHFHVRSLALFGSTARDEARDASDVDLLVEFSRPVGLLHLIETQQHLERLLGVKKADLILRRCLIEELKGEILKDVVNVFEIEDCAPLDQVMKG